MFAYILYFFRYNQEHENNGKKCQRNKSFKIVKTFQKVFFVVVYIIIWCYIGDKLEKEGELNMKNILNNIYFLVSSIGVKKYDITVCRIIRKIGLKNVGISLLGGLIVNIGNSASAVRRATYDHYVGDIPDVNWNWKRFCYDLKMINRDFSFRNLFGYLKRFVLQMFVWRFFSVVNQNALRKSILDLLKYSSFVDDEKWIRWDSRGLLENESLLQYFPKKCNILVEYYPESHTPDDFVEYIQRLNYEYYNLKFWISFDAGHFHRARKLYDCCSEMKAEKWLMSFVLNPKIVCLIRMIEISNLPEEGQNAHASVFEGVIDFKKVFCMIGWALRNKDRMKLPFFVVLEGTPLSYSEISKNLEKNLKNYLECMDDDAFFFEIKDHYNV